MSDCKRASLSQIINLFIPAKYVESGDKANILPKEKPPKTVGRPIVPYRKVLDGIFYILRTGCQWKMLPKEYGSGSVCHRRFQEWNKLDVFKNAWINLLKVYDKEVGIKWTWQSIDSISVKSPLGGPKQEVILQIGAN